MHNGRSRSSKVIDIYTNRKLSVNFLLGNPLEFRDETYLRKTRGMGLLYGENYVILASTVFDWSTRVTDRRTDRIVMAYHAIAYMLSRIKILQKMSGYRIVRASMSTARYGKFGGLWSLLSPYWPVHFGPWSVQSLSGRWTRDRASMYTVSQKRELCNCARNFSKRIDRFTKFFHCCTQNLNL